jgi:hypothetical protein
MANVIRVNFHRRIYKNQSVALDKGLIIEVGDSVTLKKRVVGGSPVAEVVTVTGVDDEGTTIEWNNGTTGVRAEDIVGIHAQHNFQCAGTAGYSFTLTEDDDGIVDAIAVEDITIDGGVFPVNAEESEVAAGIEEAFADTFIGVINGLLAGTSGYASYAITGTAGDQVLTVTVTGSPLAITDLTVVGATLSAITVS